MHPLNTWGVIIWLFTDRGFISAVAFDPILDNKNTRSKRQVKSWGPRPVLVRARVEVHLEQLRPFWSKLKIEKDDSADYEFRAIMPRSRWNDFILAAGDSIDYDSHFKEVVKKRSPGSSADKSALYSAMLRVWSAMADLQPDAPYSGWKVWPGKKDYSYGSGYTSGGVKSAADSAAIFTSGGTPLGGTTGRGYYDAATSRWVEIGDPTPSARNTYGSTTFKSPAAQVSGQLSLSGRFDEAPESVEDMAKALMLKAPNDVFVDMATPSATYDLWCRAEEEFNESLAAEDVMCLLEELVEDETSTREAVNEYSALLHRMYSQSAYAIVAADDVAPSADLDVRSLVAEFLS